MKRVLVTGASGFTGYHSLTPLLEEGYEVHGIYHNNKVNLKGIIWHQVNLLDFKKTSKLIKEIKPTHLLHFAWDVTPGKYMESPSNYEWLEASKNILAVFKEIQGQRAVISGTQLEYCSDSPYPKTKRELLEFVKNLDINYAWGRIYYLFGENENPSRLVPYVAKNLIKGEEVKCSSGEQIRDFMYVKDVAGAFVKALSSDYIGTFDVGLGEGIKIRDLVYKIAEMLNGKELVQLGALEKRVNETDVSIANITNLKNEIGFTPEFDISKGLEKVIKYYKSTNDKQ